MPRAVGVVFSCSSPVGLGTLSAVLDGRSVAVVVPAFCEERLLGTTLTSLPSFVDWICVVDDASTDRTWQVARQRLDPRVSVTRHRINRGVGAAIVSGYYQALRRGADVIVVMAGDGQMSPSDLNRLVQPILSGRADYVKGDRLRHPKVAQMPALRRLGSRALAILTSWAAGIRIADSQCGFTAFSGPALARLPLDQLWPRYGYPNDLVLMCVAHGLRVAEVAVEPVYADEHSGLRPWHVLSIAWLTLQRKNRYRLARS